MYPSIRRLHFSLKHTFSSRRRFVLLLLATGLAISLISLRPSFDRLLATDPPPRPYPGPLASRLRHTLLTRSRLIFYNRVPKCASFSLIVLFTMYHKKKPTTPTMYRSNVNSSNLYRRMPFRQQRTRVIDYLESKDKPLVYEQHVRFIDFEHHGSYPNPLYINLVREPLERMTSEYKFHMKAKTKGKQYIWPNNTQFIPFMHNIFGRNFEYFCGQDKMCGSDSDEALQRAKDNVRNHFLLVGLTNHFDKFVEMLSFLIPQYFHDLEEFYLKTNVRVNVIVKKGGFPVEIKKVLREDLARDVDFYQWIVLRFFNLYDFVADCRSRGYSDALEIVYSGNETLINTLAEFIPNLQERKSEFMF